MVNEEEQLKKEIKQLKQQLGETEPKEKKPFYYKEVSNTTAIFIIALVIMGALVYCLEVYSSGKHSKIEISTGEVSNLVKEAQSYESQASNYQKTSDGFYDNAMFSLDGKNWVNAYTNCQKARDYSSKSGEAYRMAKAKWEKAYNLVSDPELKSKITFAINIDNAGSEIQYNQYEACEGIETASHYFLQNDYVMGNQYLESANEKIKLHDYWVTVYNENLAKRKA